MRTATGLLAAAILALVPPVHASDADSARDALAALRKSMQARPALGVKSTLRIQVAQGEVTSGDGEEVVVELLWNRSGAGRVRIRDYTCEFSDGVFRAVHKDNEDAYFQSKYDGSPYWALWDLFRDLPYPHIALFWGEAAADEVLMQLHPKTPMIQPLSIEDVERDGRPCRQLRLKSDHGTLELFLDPKKQRILSAEHLVSGGPFVQAGASVRTKYTFAYTEFEQAPTERIDLSGRQRVDGLLALNPPKPAPDPRAGGAGGAQPAAPAELVGKAAPGFVLATADGGAIDLAELKGRVVVLDFWSTWCGPCRMALPVLHDLAEWADDRGLPVSILAVNTFEIPNPAKDSPDARLDAVNRFWKESAFTLPVVMDYTDETAAAYGVSGIPATYVIAPDGTVHAQHSGFGQDYAEKLRAEIEAALTEGNDAG